MPLTTVRVGETDGRLAAALDAIRAELDLPDTFPAAVEEEARAAVANVTFPDADLLDLPFLTIDPAGARDLDQAMHLERAGGGYRVRYAIADVPAFVAPGGAVDAEAMRRGQTLYPPDGRIPLHPAVIGEDAASLLPDQVRSAFVWDFNLDAAARVTSVTLNRAKIRSRRRYSYEQVQSTLDAGTASDELVVLREIGLARILRERERGGASLGRPDQEITQVDGGYRLVRRRPLPVEGWNAQLSLMTGMAAGTIMLNGRIGILRTMPAPDNDAVERFRRQTAALGRPWPQDIPYGEYLRMLDPDDPQQLAILHAAASLFRGAGYTAFDGTGPANPIQAAIAAPYAHTTAPLRRLVDRFSLLVCAALTSGAAVPQWLRAALPLLPPIMAASDAVASRLERGTVSALEAAVLSGRVGQEFVGTVVSTRTGGGVIQLSDPAVTADCEGDLPVGASVRATLVTADIATGTVLFRVAS
jgi:exoribonuclease R